MKPANLIKSLAIGLAASFPLVAPVAAQAPTSAQTAQTSIDWFSKNDGAEAAALLADMLDHGYLDGLPEGPKLAGEVRQAAAMAATNPDAANRIITAAFAAYAGAIHQPSDIIYGDEWVRPGRLSAGVHVQNASVIASLVPYLKDMARPNTLYANLRAAAVANDLTPDAEAKVIGSLSRLKAFPERGRFVLVDSAHARLWMFENGQPVDSMKIVVGKPEFATPQIASAIYYSTFNPYWHVPHHLVKGYFLDGYKRGGAGYLKSRGYEIVDKFGDDAVIVDDKTVDWAMVARTGELNVRQLPGGTNSMGDMKFNFANPEGIYLHDTPTREYFGRNDRALSNGCVRLEDAKRFAEWLYKGQGLPAANGTEEHILIPEPTPVYVTYLTANVVDGQFSLADDVYAWDPQPVQRMAGAQPAGAVAGGAL